jgi:hypothetical protein
MNVKFLETTEDIFTSTLEWLGLAWWVEIVTDNPCCTYYFGPFASEKEAKVCLGGYIEDLEQEEAQIITIDIKRGKPKELTICEDELPESIDS